MTEKSITEKSDPTFAYALIIATVFGLIVSSASHVAGLL
jgi:hypothetical protein